MPALFASCVASLLSLLGLLGVLFRCSRTGILVASSQQQVGVRMGFRLSCVAVRLSGFRVQLGYSGIRRLRVVNSMVFPYGVRFGFE